MSLPYVISLLEDFCEPFAQTSGPLSGCQCGNRGRFALRVRLLYPALSQIRNLHRDEGETGTP
jgi:hypothetical protein